MLVRRRTAGGLREYPEIGKADVVLTAPACAWVIGKK
jgi:hypothetical protein